MSVTRDDGIIRILGNAAVEDAETLAAMLEETPAAEVDWSQAGSLHTAVAQVLLVLRPTVIGTPPDAFAAQWLSPLLGLRR